MRPQPDFQIRGGGGAATAAAPYSGSPRSAWHSPVPYLFGGLAAMLGLIAFALLILACSYWKLSGYLESGGDTEAPGGSEGGKTGDGAAKPPPSVFEERIVVIMAGDHKPRFLATPIAIRPASFADKADTTTAEEGEKKPPEIPVALPAQNNQGDNERNNLVPDELQ